MPIFACPQCKQSLLLADTAMGRNVKCPNCGAIFATPPAVPPTAVSSVPAMPAPKRAAEAPKSAGQIAKTPAKVVAPAPKAVEEVFDLSPADPPRVARPRRPSGDSVKFTVIVKNDPKKRLKGRYQGSLTPAGLRLQQGAKQTVDIPAGTAAEYMGGNRLSIELGERPVQLQIAKWISYQNRLTEDLVVYLNGDKASLPASGYSLPWYFTVFVLLPLGIPILTLGGALPFLVGGGLCAINAAIVQREKWPGVLRGLLTVALALMGYAGIGMLVLGTALLTNYRAHQSDTKPLAVSIQPAVPPGPDGNPPAPPQQVKPPDVQKPLPPAPDDLKPGPAILPFSTAVIDPGANEILFLDQQKLTRCGYPDFKQGNTYSLGKFNAYASVLDSARGLLYLAVTEPQAPVMGNTYQRILGQGDIHVHDIGALRGGNIKPGAVLQPTTVISLGKKIGRLLLSPDGRWLYYLDLANAKSPRIGRIDATTHKASGELAVHEKSEEICLTPDGKTLYTAGQPTPGKGAVQVIDPVELKIVKEVPLPGSPYWLDATDQGLVFVSLRGQWTETVAVDVKTGEVALRWGGMFGFCPIRLSPDRKRLYVAITELSPSMLQAWKLPENPGEKPQKAGEVWGGATHDFIITPDGRFLLNRDRKTYRLASGKAP